MRRLAPSNFLAVSVGLMLLAVAVVCNHVTLASGRYGGVLVTAFVCFVLGLLCLSVPLARLARRPR